MAPGATRVLGFSQLSDPPSLACDFVLHAHYRALSLAASCLNFSQKKREKDEEQKHVPAASMPLTTFPVAPPKASACVVPNTPGALGLLVFLINYIVSETKLGSSL